VLWDGVYGTAMPAWRELTKDDLTDLTANVYSLESKQVAVSLPDVAFAAAKKTYDARCLSCHRENGRGDGLLLIVNCPTPPTDHQIARSRRQGTKHAFAESISGVG
jgi:hypothetical protein